MNSQDILKYISNASMWSIIIPIFFGIKNWNNFDKNIKIIVVYLIASFLCILISVILASLKINNLVIFTAMFGVEAFFAAWFYGQVIKPQKFKPFILLIGLLLNLYLVIDTIYLNSSFLKSISGKSSIFILLIDIIWAIIFIYQIITNPKTDNLNKNPLFWIAIGWLFGAIIGLFTVIYSEALWNYSKNVYNNVMNLFNIIVIIEYLVFTYAFYIKSRKLGNSY